MIKTKQELNQALRDVETAKALLRQPGFKLDDGRDAGFELRLALLHEIDEIIVQRAARVQGVVR